MGWLLQIHGILNAVSWGILLPIGVMSARYLRPFKFADPAWFYLHVFGQITGYAGGTAGWILGLRLQKYANPIKYFHRNLGISIWAIATFQVLTHLLYYGCAFNLFFPQFYWSDAGWPNVHIDTAFGTLEINWVSKFSTGTM